MISLGRTPCDMLDQSDLAFDLIQDFALFSVSYRRRLRGFWTAAVEPCVWWKAQRQHAAGE